MSDFKKDWKRFILLSLLLINVFIFFSCEDRLGIFQYYNLKQNGTISSIAAGEYISAIVIDGTLYAVGTILDEAKTFTIAENVSKVEVYETYLSYLDNTGTLWTAGTDENSDIVSIELMSNVKDFSVGDGFYLIIDNNDVVWGLGDNYSDQLGLGGSADYYYYEPVQILSDVKAVSAGGEYSLFLKNDGSVFSCGSNSYGRLGTGNSGSEDEPVEIMNDVNSIYAGYKHSLFIKTDNTLWACGYNDYNNYADDSFGYSNYTPILIASGVASAFVGDGYSFYITAAGELYAIGNNSYNRLGAGDGYSSYLTNYQLITDEADAVFGSVRNYSLLLKQDGTLWGAGTNYYGQLGSADEELEYTEFTLLF